MDLEALVQLMQHEKVTLNMNLKTSVSLHFPILNKNSLPTSHTYLSIFQVYNGHFFTRFIFVQNEKNNIGLHSPIIGVCLTILYLGHENVPKL
jgi:hypothetical protein